MNPIILRLFQRSEALGIPAPEYAARRGLEFLRLCDIADGERVPDAAELVRIANALELPLGRVVPAGMEGGEGWLPPVTLKALVAAQVRERGLPNDSAFAQEIGVGVSVLRRMIAGRQRSIPLEACARLAGALGVRTAALLPRLLDLRAEVEDAPPGEGRAGTGVWVRGGG